MSYLKKLKDTIDLKRIGEISYDEMGDILLGKDNHYSSDNLRKFFYVMDKIVDKIEDSAVLNDEQIKAELEAQRKAMQKERYKYQIAKIEERKANRREAKQELFYETLSTYMDNLPIPDFKPVKIDSESNKEYVLGMGDLHFGATFKSQNNQYSIDECKNRFKKLAYLLEEEIKRNSIPKIKILNVADTIQGILRLSDLQINELPVVESVIEVSRLLAQFLNEISTYCDVEYYHCSAANHSQIRPLGSKASEIATEDLEKVIVSYISDLLANNKNVKIYSDLEKDYLKFKIFNFNAIMLHGHQIKNVENAIKDLSNLHREFYDYCFLGHRHSANEIIVGETKTSNIEILTCPAFIGSDPYADSLMVGSKAMVKLYEFDSVYGHTASRNIILN